MASSGRRCQRSARRARSFPVQEAGLGGGWGGGAGRGRSWAPVTVGKPPPPSLLACAHARGHTHTSVPATTHTHTHARSSTSGHLRARPPGTPRGPQAGTGVQRAVLAACPRCSVKPGLGSGQGSWGHLGAITGLRPEAWTWEQVPPGVRCRGLAAGLPRLLVRRPGPGPGPAGSLSSSAPLRQPHDVGLPSVRQPDQLALGFPPCPPRPRAA